MSLQRKISVALFMHMMKYYVVGAMALILVAAGGYYFLKGDSAVPSTGEENQNASISVATSTYATTSYSIIYPSNYTADSSYANTTVSPTKPIAGVKFTIPLTVATGTNLSADSYISVEQLPRAKNCTADIYLAANVTATSEMINSVSYSFASSTEGAAGNRYEELVFARAGSDPCTAVRYVIHSTEFSNYPAGTVREFDRAALILEFDKIRDSLLLSR